MAALPQNSACFSCGAQDLSLFYEVRGVPVNSCLLIDDRQEALNFPRGDLQLVFCKSCGFIFNAAFEPGLLEYSSAYEETQGFSPRFQEFARDLANRLVERHRLKGKSILEIGCGKGEFLALLCELGENEGIGIDPAYVEGRLPEEQASRAVFIRDFYSPAYADLSADVIICRHTLEHIQPVRDLVSLVAAAARNRDDTLVFFEVPDVLRVLREMAFWDIYYEHCSYFSLGSLARLFRDRGFEVLDLRTDFEEQYLLLEARAAHAAHVGESSAFVAEQDLELLEREVERFEAEHEAKLDAWRDDLERVRKQGQRVVLWGAGSKAVAYLTTLGVADEITYLVDVNPFKHGKYLAGTGHEVVAPAFLQEYRPDIVIAANPIYREEIRSDLEKMDLHPELIAL